MSGPWRAVVTFPSRNDPTNRTYSSVSPSQKKKKKNHSTSRHPCMSAGSPSKDRLTFKEGLCLDMIMRSCGYCVRWDVFWGPWRCLCAIGFGRNTAFCFRVRSTVLVCVSESGNELRGSSCVSLQTDFMLLLEPHASVPFSAHFLSVFVFSLYRLNSRCQEMCVYFFS